MVDSEPPIATQYMEIQYRQIHGFISEHGSFKEISTIMEVDTENPGILHSVISPPLPQTSPVTSSLLPYLAT